MSKDHWKDSYTWVHSNAAIVECSACHLVCERKMEGKWDDPGQIGWSSIGKGTPFHMLGPGESNPPFQAWTCSGCSKLFTEQTGMKFGDDGWWEAHDRWVGEQNDARQNPPKFDKLDIVHLKQLEGEARARGSGATGALLARVIEHLTNEEMSQ